MGKKDYFADWFCGGLYNAERLCSESPIHRGCAEPGRGETEGGKRGHWHHHAHPAGWEDRRERPRCLSSGGYGVFCCFLPHWYEGQRKGFKLKALKSKQDVWAREKGAILNPCEDPKRIEIWRLGAFHWIIACTAFSSHYLCLHPPLQSHTSSSS